jgi:hypothetical protein
MKNNFVRGGAFFLRFLEFELSYVVRSRDAPPLRFAFKTHKFQARGGGHFSVFGTRDEQDGIFDVMGNLYAKLAIVFTEYGLSQSLDFGFRRYNENSMATFSAAADDDSLQYGYVALLPYHMAGKNDGLILAAIIQESILLSTI